MKAAEKEERRAFLGASEAAAILGVDPWKKPIDIWMAKTSERPAEDDPDTGPAAWGRFLEHVLVERWMRETQLPLAYRGKRTRTFTHPLYEFLRATPDAYHVPAPFVGPDYLVEAKTSRYGKGFGDPFTDEIPKNYRVQAIAQAAITGAGVVHLPLLIAGSDFRRYIIEPTQDERDAIVAAMVEFWTLNVIPGIPPDEISEEYARQRWPDDSGDELIATDEDAALVKDYKLARYNREQAEQTEGEQKLAIMARMGDHSRLLGPGFRISWKKAKDAELTDWALFADALRRMLETIPRASWPKELLAQLGDEEPLEEYLATVRSIYTRTRPGARVFRPQFDEEEEGGFNGE